MKIKRHYFSVSALLMAAPFYVGMATAADHAEAALKHATEAASSKDAKTVGEHAAEALKHIEQSKGSAVSISPEDLKHIEAGKKDLKAAVRHSKFHNTDSAIKNAADGAAHLEAADTEK